MCSNLQVTVNILQILHKYLQFYVIFYEVHSQLIAVLCYTIKHAFWDQLSIMLNK